MRNSMIILAMVLVGCHTAPTPKETSSAPDTVKNTPVNQESVKLTPEQIKNAGIVTALPEKREMHGLLKVSGLLEVPPDKMATVTMPLGGYVRKMNIIPGEKVAKGSVMAVLEDPQYIQLQQDYLTAVSKLQFLEADFARQKGLNETKAVSDKVFQQVQADYGSQKVQAKALSEKLLLIGIDPSKLNEGNISRSINVYAPMSGYVTKVNVNVGKYLSPSDAAFEVVSRDELHLTLTVFENDAAQLSVGQKLICSTNSRPDVKYTAVIHLITPNIGEDRATEVHCDLENYDKALFPGTYMNAQVQTGSGNVMAVPEEAVVKWEGKNYVFVEAGADEYKMQPVGTGLASSGFVEIRQGLPDAKVVVAKGAYTLLMKLKNNGEE